MWKYTQLISGRAGAWTPVFLSTNYFFLFCFYYPLNWSNSWFLHIPGNMMLLVHCCCWVAQVCLTLCDPTDCSPPGSSVHGVLQARTLAAIPFSRASSWPRDRTHMSRIDRQILYLWATGEALADPGATAKAARRVGDRKSSSLHHEHSVMLLGFLNSFGHPPPQTLTHFDLHPSVSCLYQANILTSLWL